MLYDKNDPAFISVDSYPLSSESIISPHGCVLRAAVND